MVFARTGICGIVCVQIGGLVSVKEVIAIGSLHTVVTILPCLIRSVAVEVAGGIFIRALQRHLGFDDGHRTTLIKEGLGLVNHLLQGSLCSGEVNRLGSVIGGEQDVILCFERSVFRCQFVSGGFTVGEQLLGSVEGIVGSDEFGIGQLVAAKGIGSIFLHDGVHLCLGARDAQLGYTEVVLASEGAARGGGHGEAQVAVGVGTAAYDVGGVGGCLACGQAFAECSDVFPAGHVAFCIGGVATGDDDVGRGVVAACVGGTGGVAEHEVAEAEAFAAVNLEVLVLVDLGAAPHGVEEGGEVTINHEFGSVSLFGGVGGDAEGAHVLCTLSTDVRHLVHEGGGLCHEVLQVHGSFHVLKFGHHGDVPMGVLVGCVPPTHDVVSSCFVDELGVFTIFDAPRTIFIVKEGVTLLLGSCRQLRVP